MLLIVSHNLIPKGFSALTIFPFVLVKNHNCKSNGILINHENIHLRQQLEMLVLPFFVWYGVEFLIRWGYYKDRRKAYRYLSFENEAYAKENQLDYLSTRKFWAFLNFF